MQPGKTDWVIAGGGVCLLLAVIACLFSLHGSAGAVEALGKRVAALRPKGDAETAAGGGTQRPVPGPGQTKETAALWSETKALRLKADQLTFIGSSPTSGDVGRQNLKNAVGQALGEIRLEAHVSKNKSLARSMEAAAVNNVRLMTPSLKLTDDQQGKMEKIYREEAAACGELLVQTDRGEAYQQAAGQIIDRTQKRIEELLTPEQLTKFRKTSIDPWGPGLDYERKPR